MRAIAVLAHLMDAEGKLGRESLTRLKAAVQVDREDPCDLFLTTGWDYRDDCAKKIGEVMAQNLISQFGIHKDRIVVDGNARDTVGDAYFLRKNVIVPRNIDEVIVVTSDYHLRRTAEIFGAMLSPKVAVSTFGADTGLKEDEQTLRHEEASLASFRKTFAGVNFAHDVEVCKALNTKHPFYNGDIFSKIDCGEAFTSPEQE